VRRTILIIAMTALLPWTAAGGPGAVETRIGRATAVDGDTIELHGERIRLFGIDAPEARQSCARANGEPYRCGQVAAFALADRIADKTVRCDPRERDRHGRAVATCHVDEMDVAEWMVAQGLALDWPRYSGGRYAAAQAVARGQKRGMWQGMFQPPWDWRRGGG
jgi:endonuclease YncB( thermonuclease family)